MVNTKDTKIKKLTLYSAIVSLVFLVFPLACHADPVDAVLKLVLGWLASFVAWALGGIITLCIGAIIEVTKYNNFVNEPTIKEAWAIVRDISNMFFILILLLIAFATILRVETYNMKRWLPKLLIMAVLINFSKTICGIMIDFSQVIMLTFVNTFATTGGDFVSYLQIKEFIAGVQNSGKTWGKDSIDLGNVAVGYMVAVIFMLVACVAMVAILIVFVMRMIMLWIFVVLSPLAFMLSSFPQGQSYASRYWGEFTRYLINGPVLAFFIWLALSTINNLNVNTFSGTETNVGVIAGVTQIMTLQYFMTFVLAIGFLVGGLMISQQIGGVGANWGMSTVRNLGNKGLSMAKRTATAPLRATGAVAKFGGGVLLDKVSHGSGVDLNIPRVIGRVKTQMKVNSQKRADEVYESALDTAKESKSRLRSTFALASTGDLGWRAITEAHKNDLFTRVAMGNKRYNPKELLEKTKEKKQEALDKKGLHSREEWMEHRKNKEDLKEIEEQRLKPGLSTKEQLDLNEKSKALKKKIEDHESSGKIYDQKKVDEIDAKFNPTIEKYEKRVKEFTDIPGWVEAKQDAEKARRGRFKGTVGQLENSDELGQMVQEGLRTGETGLTSEALVRMTRLGDYNEFAKKLNIGTGREGMLQLAKILERQGNFSRQAALKLVAEIGGIAKNIKHFGAYGAVKLENGEWKESSDNEYQAAMLSEMLKLEPQDFVRNVNRLGLGEYTGPEGILDADLHDGGHWKPSAAAIAYLKLNGDKLAEQYLSRGQQNAIEFLASKLDVLEKAGVGDKTIENIKLRSQTLGKGTDAMEQIKEVKSNLGAT